MPGSALLYKEGFVLRKNIMEGPHKKGKPCTAMATLCIMSELACRRYPHITRVFNLKGGVSGVVIGVCVGGKGGDELMNSVMQATSPKQWVRMYSCACMTAYEHRQV